MTKELNFKFYLIFINLNRHIWLVATTLNTADIEHFHHFRIFHWTTLL